ncbi:hypothetical protein JCM8547_002794 [Rhodosporidiobolus lusitaniae]
MFSGTYPATSPASWSRETSFLQARVARETSSNGSAVADEEASLDDGRGRTLGKRRSFASGRASGSMDSRLSPTEEAGEGTTDEDEDDEDTLTLPGTSRERERTAEQEPLTYPSHSKRIFTETTPLLATSAPASAPGLTTAADEQALRQARKLNDDARDAYSSEAKVLTTYQIPILGTHFLEFSLTAATVLFLGHLGETELAAASLGNLTNNFLALSVIQGFCTALDTLCPQAYTSDYPKLTSTYAFRTWIVTLFVFIPQAAAFWWSEHILTKWLHQDPDVAHLASRYLRILIPSLPAYAGFEVIRRWLQAQGLMTAPVIALTVAAPFNILLNWLLVSGPVDKLRIGFIGAPIATVVSVNVMFVVLLAYAIFRTPRTAWGGITPAIVKDLGLNVRLGLAGVGMVGSEWWSWEIVGLATSFLGPTALAAQSVLLTSASFFYQFQFSLSIACSVRVGNLLGAQKPHLARVASRVTIVIAILISGVNSLLLVLLRNSWGQLFSSEPEIIDMVARVLPLVAAFQLWDGLSGAMGGVLRGAGKPTVGAIINTASYYVVGIPLGLALAFWGPHLGLNGLWLGLTAALTVTGISSTLIVWKMDWEAESELTRRRLAAAKRDQEATDDEDE